MDIGSHVQQGQLLAEIDTPEVNQQLRQARADLATAQANLNLSEITADRHEGLLKTDSVSKQESDNASGDFEAKQAALQSSQANVKRLEELQSFQKIYAPFSGVITARNTDIGALINSGGSGGNGNELFHIAQPDKLRVYVSVPRAYSQAAKPGLTADLTLAEFPGRRFAGKLVRTAMPSIQHRALCWLRSPWIIRPGSFSPDRMRKYISSCLPDVLAEFCRSMRYSFALRG